MTMRSKFAAKIVAMTVALPMLAMSPIAASAAEAELALLGSYVGSWRGEGALTGGGRNEPFRCRLTVATGNQGKINYSGRCTLVNATLSISGTIAYNDATQQYEAAMSSNAGYTGLAVGQQNQGRISFDLKERQKDRTGSDVRIGSKILLEGNDSITVDFEVEFNDSGEVLTASVPFSQ
ncbi:protein of unknown function [Devosia sp. YR412]|uniref:heme-binding beta-barrel domain-containing protein n=1 Tax=Devosia sp. YR412 TaxID=1881030 RepID=UPI0008D63F63|nr:heme-binding beta-barrel domain-containing protein [Devosia sp. YR412]SEQ15440.1 protein of unknown function [Devosia sp. YR412]